jgi:hypothetical protein
MRGVENVVDENEGWRVKGMEEERGGVEWSGGEEPNEEASGEGYLCEME